MNFLERNLEDIIFNAPPNKLKGLRVPILKKRQLKIGNYGIADIVAVKTEQNCPNSRFLRFFVYELKQKEINLSSFIQAVKYAKGIQHYLDKVQKLCTEEYKITIVLIGEKVNMSEFIYLPDIFTFNGYSDCGVDIELYTYSYDYDGIKFQEHREYSLTNPGF